MLGLDLGDRCVREVAGVKWTIGLIPNGKLIELQAAVADASGGFGADDPPEKRGLAWDRLLRAYVEVVRWGVRGWSPGKHAPVFVEESYDGQGFRVLDRAQAATLAWVEGGSLICELGQAVFAANTLTKEDVLGF